MKRWAVWILAVAAGLLAAVSDADWSHKTTSTQRAPIRAYVGATVQQYDTLAVPGPGHRVEVQNFTVYADDSAQTGILNIHFINAITKQPYLRLTQGPYTANQIVTTSWTGPWVFPKDSTILIYYNITAATPATLDTMRAVTTWKTDLIP